MTFIKELNCKSCKRKFSPILQAVCDFCYGPLSVSYELELIKEKLTKSKIRDREKSILKFIELLPINVKYKRPLNHVGNTPLRKVDNLAKSLGIKNLYLKDDSCNPTGSFKDRPASVAISKAIEWDLKKIACVSTGNLASATAAAASISDLRCKILIPDNLSEEKILSTLIYNPEISTFNGSYDQINRKANLLSDKEGWVFVNIGLRPYYLEGSKTLLFETLEQLDWQQPNHLVVPLGSGALLEATEKAIEELSKIDFIPDSKIKLSGAQGYGCSPIVNAFKDNSSYITPVQYPETIVKSLAIGDPASGLTALRAIKSSKGWAENPSNQEIIDCQLLLAKTEGLFAEQTGGTVIASLKRKIDEGVVDPSDTTVLFNTATGLKTLGTIRPYLQLGKSIQSISNQIKVVN